MRSIRRAASVGVCRESAVAAGRSPGGPSEASCIIALELSSLGPSSSLETPSHPPLERVEIKKSSLLGAKIYWVKNPRPITYNLDS